MKKSILIFLIIIYDVNCQYKVHPLNNRFQTYDFEQHQQHYPPSPRHFSDDVELIYPIKDNRTHIPKSQRQLYDQTNGETYPSSFNENQNPSNFDQPGSFYGNSDFQNNWDSLKSRDAPKEEDLKGGDYRIPSDELKLLRNEFMYWYFDKGGNDGNGDYQTNIHSSNKNLHKNFNFQFPFFGFRFNYTRVSLDGYLEFSDPPFTYDYPLSFPIKDWPKVNDPSFIGIFYSKCKIGVLNDNDIDRRKPGVYFRMERDLENRYDKFGVQVRERIKWDIREGMVGAETFVPKHVAIITWKNISFNGGNIYANKRTNTFQIVLATDEVFSYVIFNYLTIVWTTHTEAGGDPTNGEGGTPAFVGFNAGNGTQSFEYYPYSQMSTVRDLTSRGWGNGKPGRHIFRVDEKILLGTCNKDTSGTNLQLTFAPESGNMLGGTVVNITGPCFEPNQKVTCRFDTEEVIGTVIDRNRLLCVQPRIYVEGYVPFEIAIGSGKYNWVGKYFVEPPAQATEKIFFDGPSVHEKYPAAIKITWNAHNLTTNHDAGIRISIWGYREVTIKPELEYIDVIETRYSNLGFYTIYPSNFKNRWNEYQQDFEFGFLQINLTNPEQYSGLSITPVIWSRPIPLGWYFAHQWEKIHGDRWPEQLCNHWIINDRYSRNFAHELPQCPCKLEHALNDKGRFLPDPDCDQDINPKCLYNKGAIHCVKSGAPSLDGAQQQCCYDKNHFLMISYDQQWGSRPYRSHNLGYIPWNEANKVPTLSQWYRDMRPIYSCCLWQEEQAVGCETLRFELRPTQDCIGYQSPGVATVFGDPHFITYDNLPYTFNGKGEFVLTRVNTPKLKLDVQGRFEQLPINALGETRATQLSAIAAKGNNSAIIEVRVRPRDAQWRYRLDVLANGKKIYFDRPSLKSQHFPGVVVYAPTYIFNQSEIVIMFESGAGVEVIENQGYMSTRIYLPWTFINTTRGLLGNWSFDRSDDFKTPEGTQVSVDLNNILSFERIHRDFAIQWLLQDKEDPLKGGALFTREFGKTSATYSNRSFVPVWNVKPENILPQNRSYDINRAYELCGEIYQCQFDYAVSLDRDLAFFTKNYYNSYTEIRELNENPVISCGVLETPRFGRKSNFFFVPDTKVTFECNENFVLVGDKRRTCLPNGKWDMPEYGYTECLRYVEYDSQQLLNTGAYISLFIVPLLLLICCAGAYVVKKSKEDRPGVSQWQFAQTPRSRSASRLRLNEIDSGASSPLKGQFDSPSQSSKNDIKRPLSYDGVYHTNEPLPGKPNIEFEEKPWDLNEDKSTRVNHSVPNLMENDQNDNPDGSYVLSYGGSNDYLKNIEDRENRRNIAPANVKSYSNDVNFASILNKNDSDSDYATYDDSASNLHDGRLSRSQVLTPTSDKSDDFPPPPLPSKESLLRAQQQMYQSTGKVTAV